MARLARSRPRVGVGYFGPLPDNIWTVLRVAHAAGFSISSNFAREYSTEVALASSVGWISVVSLDGGGYSRTWRITLEGLAAYRREHEAH